jgi:hypothetical protein
MRTVDAETAQEVAKRIRTVPSRAPEADTDVMRSIEQAVIGRHVVELLYQDRRGSSTTRTVEAHGLHLTQKSGYLIGWCRLRDAGRAFRLDRIEKAIVQDEIAPERDVDPLLDWVEGASAPDVVSERRGPRTATTGDEGGRPFWLRHDPGELSPTERRRADALAARMRSIALALPQTAEKPHHGWPGFTVRDHFFTVLQSPSRIWLRATPSDEETLTAERPEVFRRDHGLEVVVDHVEAHELHDLVEQSWRLVAPRALAAAYDTTA